MRGTFLGLVLGILCGREHIFPDLRVDMTSYVLVAL